MPTFDLGKVVGDPGKDGKDGVSCTHSWNGTTLTVTSASGASSADLKGEPGKDGYTPIKGKDYFDGQDGAAGKDGYTPVKGVDYVDGKDGTNGKDGVSVTHSWNGTTLTVTSASGTSSANLKGASGKDGHTPEKGVDYWTAGEKAEIVEEAATSAADKVNVPSVVQTTGFDTSKVMSQAAVTMQLESKMSLGGAENVDRLLFNSTDYGNTGTHHRLMFGDEGFLVHSYADSGNLEKNYITITRHNGLELSGLKAPTSDDSATNKEYVDNAVRGYSLPDYWKEYIDAKCSTIKALQDAGGKDCFSFVVMTDLHFPSNLGKRSPDLARKIMDEINAKYAFCLGDVQTRGCWHTKDEVASELASVEAFFAPIKNRLLRTQGNHDGSYGWLDRDGSGDYSNTGKAPADRETYVHNLTPAEIYERFYRPNSLVGDIHTDESGTGYYIDDNASKVRYIVLNTQKNDYELQEDGTQKYPNMWLFRFTQSQFDFLTKDALVTGLTDAWSVVVFGHCPLYQEIGDREVMQGVLNAYKNKTTYNGEYAGTAGGGTSIVKGYTNLAEPLPDNKTDTTKWVNGYRFSSTAISAQAGTTLSNVIECTNGDVIRIKGVTLRSGTDRFAVNRTADSTGVTADSYGYYNSPAAIGGNALWSFDGLTDGVYKFTIGSGAFTVNSLRFAMPTPEDASSVIITVNEEIKETVVTTGGYDSVSVDVDFTAAKGNLVGYFAGHVHVDNNTVTGGVPVITTRCDAKEENTDALKTERVVGTTTEQSFDVFTVNTKTKTIHATKIGAGGDRTITY